MRFRHVVSCLLLTVAGVGIMAQESAPTSRWAPQTIDWIKKHAIAMRTFAPTDPDFSDLERLAALIGNARIVMLGEPSHGDGTTFLAKNRLIAFLHQRMGFDVLCFESGIYDCHKAWEALLAGADPLVAMRKGIFRIWLDSRHLEPLTEYVGSAARTARPLEICGYDCQLSGTAARESLVSELRALAAEAGASDAWIDGEATVKSLIERATQTAESRSSGAAALGRLSESLGLPQMTARHSSRELAFWRQVLESLQGQIEVNALEWGGSGPIARFFNPRDAQGARNLLWLARTHYPDRKIIVWAASMHLLRHHEQIDTLDPKLDYAGTLSMGHHASAALGPSVFTIAFTAGGGEAGTVGGARWKISPPQPGSFEALCVAAGLDNAIIPVSSDADAPFHQPILARPLGYSFMKADWRRHLDAFVFTANMERSRRRYSKEETEASRDLLGALEKEAAQCRERAASGHAYAEKGGLETPWERWVDIFEPTAAARKEAASKVRAWATGLPPHPALTWRVHRLLSQLANEDHDLETAVREIDAAMSAYPDTTHKDPSSQSSYQHLANEKGMLLVDSVGFEAALAWIARAFESEPRFRCLHPIPWLDRFSGERERSELKRVIGLAYEKRATAFPNEAARLEKDWEASQKLWTE